MAKKPKPPSPITGRWRIVSMSAWEDDSPPKPAPARERDDFPERKPAPFLRTEKQVGRNDPCPCGSGKKFKKGCMSRGKG